MRRMFLAAALIVGSVGLTDAQMPAWAQREAERPWTPDRKLSLLGSFYLKPSEAFLQAESAVKNPDGPSTFQTVTITLGDFKITADTATLGQGDQIGKVILGENVRLVIPDRYAK